MSDGEGTRSHLLRPVHDDDLRYLASLWDTTFTNFDLDHALVGDFGVNNSHFPQDNLFGWLDEPPLPSSLATVQGAEQRSPQPLPATQSNTTSNLHVPAQPLRSLDVLDNGFSAQYLGLSGDIDPFLLRHIRFSKDGIFDFGRFQYRRMAERSVVDNHFPSPEQTPTHFVINGPKPDEDCDTTFAKDHDPELILEKLVTPDLRARLVSLLVAVPTSVSLRNADENMHLDSYVMFSPVSRYCRAVGSRSARRLLFPRIDVSRLFPSIF